MICYIDFDYSYTHKYNICMIRINARLSTKLFTRNAYGFAGLPFGKKRAAVKSNLDKYDVVIVGGHLGPVLSNHLDAVVGPKASIFVAFDRFNYYLNTNRVLY